MIIGIEGRVDPTVKGNMSSRPIERGGNVRRHIEGCAITLVLLAQAANHLAQGKQRAVRPPQSL